VLSGRGLCDELITRPEESYRLCYVVVCDLETSRMGAPYICDISRLRVNVVEVQSVCCENHTKRINTLCGKIKNSSTSGGKYSNHRVFKRLKTSLMYRQAVWHSYKQPL